LFPALLSVEGVWNTPLINRIPLPDSTPVVSAPPTLSEYVLPIPVNWSDISSNTILVS